MLGKLNGQIVAQTPTGWRTFGETSWRSVGEITWRTVGENL